MTDFPCCDNGEHGDPLDRALVDALRLYDPTMDCEGIARHLAVVLRRGYSIVELVRPPQHPVRLWGSAFEFLAGDDGQATTRPTEDGYTVTVPVASPMHEAARAASRTMRRDRRNAEHGYVWVNTEREHVRYVTDRRRLVALMDRRLKLPRRMLARGGTILTAPGLPWITVCPNTKPFEQRIRRELSGLFDKKA